MTERTRHHLTPREVGGSRLPTAALCRTCHRQLHALYSNEELGQRNSIEKLRRDPRVAAYLNWVRKRPGATVDRARPGRRSRD